MYSLILSKASRLFFLSAFILITSMPAFAGTFYVRADGDDSNSGLENTSSGAWATIQKAADTLKPGDTAEIQSGTYNEAVTITTSGIADQYIVFRANGEVIIDTRGKEGPSFKLDGANYIRIEGITCKSAATSGISLANSNNNILIRNVSTSASGNGIEADSASADNQLIGNITSQSSSSSVINAVTPGAPASSSSGNPGLPAYLSASGPNKAKFAPDEIIVKFKKGAKLTPSISSANIAVTGLASVDTLHKKLNVTSMKKLFKGGRPKAMKLKRTALPTETPPDLSNIYKLKIGKEITVPEAVEMYRKDPNVEYAEPNYIAQICLLPNDPYYYSSGSWGQSYQDLWGLHKIEVTSAWDIKRGEDVAVAVIDTGIDYNHPDIDQNVWTNPAESGGISGVDDDGNGYIDDTKGWDFYNSDNDSIDDHGHGTHVSGTIAAEGNNGMGVIGVAYNAKIMALKGLRADGKGYDSDLAEAMAYAADNGADVLSNSWGGPGRSQILEDAVNYAHSLGCVIVVAAGNDYSNASNFTPANIVNVITVSAFDNNDAKAPWSNWGAKIDVAAPGVDVLSLRAQGTDMYGDGTHIVGQDYYRANGTSMACPHVSGVAALILSNHPSFTNEQVRQALRISADDVDQSGWDINSGYGRINAYKALLVNNPSGAKVTSPLNFEYFDKQGTITGTISGQFDEWRLYYSPVDDGLNETLLQTGFVNEINYIWDTTSIQSGNYCIKLKVFNQSSLSAVDTVEITLDHRTQWVARYNGPVNGSDVANAIAVDVSGNVYVTGYSDNGGTPGYDYATIKYDTNGDQLWAASYNGLGNSKENGDYAHAIAVDASGNVYVTGESWGSGTNNDYATIKYDTNGNQLWVARYNDPGNGGDYATAIAVDTLGNVYVTGSSDGNGTGVDYATIKYDTNGNQLWVARYNGLGNEFAAAIALDSSGNVYVTGNGYGDYATVKYDTNGNQLWVAKYNKAESDHATAIAVDAVGNVYVTGSSWNGWTAYYDYATIKYDTNGNQLWVARYNGPESDWDEAFAIALDASGNVYVTGSVYGDYATIKYDTNGNQLWVARYNGPEDSWDYATAIAVDASGNVYVTGDSGGSGTGPDYATIKYSQGGAIGGKVTLQGRTNHSAPIAFELRNPGETTPIMTYNITTDSQGSFNLIGIPAGTYDLTAKSSNSLRAKQAGIIVQEGQSAPDVDLNLLGGDANNDNSIGTGDMVILRSAWLTHTGEAKWDQRADFNNDGSIGTGDMVILKNNWLKQGEN